VSAPICVAVGVVTSKGKILLITRPNGTYEGLWSMPGGKIEQDEHVGDAAVREVKEETGVRCDFARHLGVVSEHFVEHGAIQKHFLLHLCELTPRTMQIAPQDGEGEPRWFSLSEIDGLRDRMIPSDYAMIGHFLQRKGKQYIECVIEKDGDRHEIVKFS
jgi:8-oxo-dGTP pyrophosphatase MutT (NUDIX family)